MLIGKSKKNCLIKFTVYCSFLLTLLFIILLNIHFISNEDHNSEECLVCLYHPTTFIYNEINITHTPPIFARIKYQIHKSDNKVLLFFIQNTQRGPPFILSFYKYKFKISKRSNI